MDNHQNRSADRGLLPFDLIVTVIDVCKRWLLILLASVLVGVSTYIITDLRYEPVYRSTTTFVVIDQNSSATVYNNLSSTSALAGVFSDLLNSSLLRASILEDLGRSSFDGTIQAYAINETNLLGVIVTASDPQTAFLVSQAIIAHHADVTYQVVDGITLDVLQSPTVPMVPLNTANALGQMKRNMLIAAVAMALLLGTLSYFRDVVRSSWEAQTKLDGPFLGELPHEKKYRTLLSWLRRRKTGILVTNPLTSFGFVETLHKLRRRLELRLHGRQVLMVTSLLENEGKSTVAVNLALSLAKKHEKVLLIDCDLHKPACHTLLNQTSVAHGLRDVLNKQVSASDALLQDKKSGLHMLLEPKASTSAGELLNTPKIEALLQWARTEYEYIILDLPPMAQISDAESMSHYADASILVVRQNVAKATILNKAISALENGNAKFLGTVLNDVHSTHLSSGRDYGYGSYGKYGRYGKYGHYGAEHARNEET